LLCKLQKGCTRLAAASDKVYQLLAHGQWFLKDKISNSVPVGTTKLSNHQDLKKENL
jgi:hypothetical protein